MEPTLDLDMEVNDVKDYDESEQFEDKNDMLDHMWTFHSYNCDQCDKKFLHNDDLKRHLVVFVVGNVEVVRSRRKNLPSLSSLLTRFQFFADQIYDG